MAIEQAVMVPEADPPTLAAQLAAHEATIERGFRSFIEMGQAFVTIKQQELYKATHPSWERYLSERWPGIKENYANKLIRASLVAQELQGVGTVVPTREAQVRPLLMLKDPDERKEAWKRAHGVAKRAGRAVPTAEDVDGVVRRMRRPAPRVVEHGHCAQHIRDYPLGLSCPDCQADDPLRPARMALQRFHSSVGFLTADAERLTERVTAAPISALGTEELRTLADDAAVLRRIADAVERALEPASQ
jgi:hypothetical protein